MLGIIALFYGTFGSAVSRCALLFYLCLGSAADLRAERAGGSPHAAGANRQEASSLPDDRHFGQFLRRYRLLVDAGAVIDYRGVSAADRALLAEYVQSLGRVDPHILPRDAQLVFWINLYNSRMILLVLEHGIPASVRDIKPNFGAWLAGGPWKAKLMTVAGEKVSFDDIEHGILRKRWREPRIHFVLNCASLGCPDIPPEPLRPDRLERQLQRATEGFINSNKGVQQVGDAWVLSSIFTWFAEDFGADQAERLGFINRYRASPIPGGATLDYQYDWALNAPQAAR